jgi:hypothetical protein
VIDLTKDETPTKKKQSRPKKNVGSSKKGGKEKTDKGVGKKVRKKLDTSKSVVSPKPPEKEVKAEQPEVANEVSIPKSPRKNESVRKKFDRKPEAETPFPGSQPVLKRKCVEGLVSML